MRPILRGLKVASAEQLPALVFLPGADGAPVLYEGLDENLTLALTLTLTLTLILILTLTLTLTLTLP